MRKKAKIGIVALTLGIVFAMIFMVAQTYASGSKFLSIVGEHNGQSKNGVYKITNIDPQKTIWKIVSYENQQGGEANYNEDIYCINPKVGFGSATTAGNDIKEYNFSFDMRNLTSVDPQYKNIVPFTSTAKCNSVLWILDHSYLLHQEPETDRQLVKKALYEAAGITRDVLTDYDIEVVQQLALWYVVTDAGDTGYHYSAENFPSIAVDGTQIEQTGGPLDSHKGQQRQNDMKALYKYFIDNATNYGSESMVEVKEPNISFTKPENDTITTVESIDNTEYFVAGPYHITDSNKSSLLYTLEGSIKDQNGSPIEDYKLLDASKSEMQDAKLDKSMMDKDFYIAIPKTNTTVTKIVLDLKGDYFTTKATCWTNSNTYESEQPVVEVEKEKHSFETSKEVKVTRPQFDLSLRKFITQINEIPVTGREPQVNVDGLKAGSSKTAVYTHPKDAVGVKKGDVVIYTIRVYNEGEVDGYAEEITDNIPDGLKFLEKHAINIQYLWRLNEGATKITTNYLSREKGEENKLLAFNPSNMNTLHYKEVKVAFEVIEPNTSDRVLTNIAEISNDSDDDRDSTPNNNVETEDDIDKESLKLEYFDLSLRKFITGVNDKTIENREPQVDVSKLLDESSTTATYTHPKEPVGVKKGDKVIYTIRVYNEGKIDGYAEQITDIIPEGLQFVPIEQSDINRQYRWVASGNKVTTDYLSQSQGTDRLIKAFDKDAERPSLAYQDVKIELLVVEPNTSERVLRNIAEITQDSSDDTDSIPNNVDPSDYRPPEDNSTYQEDDDDYDDLKLEYFDLNLRKFITGVNDRTIENREPQVDVSKLLDGSSTTATYTHPKQPVGVKNGDKIIYTIRVYNEGKIDGYAEEITDNIPEGLRFVPAENSTINQEYGWVLSEDGTKITTNYLSSSKGIGNLIKAFDKSAATPTLDYKDVKVEFEVIEPDSSDRVLTNIAEITKDSDDDLDSIPDNDNEDEDDRDEEHVKLRYFDLSLRKFITGVNDKVLTDREPQVDVSKLLDESSTTATYNHSKEPVGVKTGDKVVYTIRVYNEGKIDGYAEEITDHIPEGLRFIPAEESSINEEYGWVVSEDGTKITTDYLSEAKGKENLIKAFDRTAETPTLDYKDVKVEFEVIEPNSSDRVLTNIAEITEDSDDDLDSEPDNDEEDEDDRDEEHVKLEYFDLSLRKFITKVNDQKIETRYPQVSLNTEGELEYTHPKDPILVANNDIVIYTIRVYNEGKIDGYAKEVTDDIPAGLSYLPEHEINKQYGWVVSEDGKTVTTDYLSKEKSEEREEDNLLKAFDKTKGVITEEGKLNPDYRDLQIAFKVTETNLATDRMIINTAEIIDDSDKDGKDIEDEDSTPDNGKEDEDDLDKESLKVQYFDLSLLKWVSKVYVTENGKTTVRETGHTGAEKPEPVVKVDINRKNIKNLSIKFGYVIKVTNEGEIAGYAKEISDYIPEGLTFDKADNPDWEEKEGKIVTRKLENTLLQPGESASVEVILTWTKDAENVGQKVNVAEISEDYNEHDSKDTDSIPDNKKEGEDDIDDAPVLLTINTGSMPTYIGLSVTILTMLAGGIFLIKKYVLEV